MAKADKPQRGRPWPEDHERAETNIVLRTKRTRKGAYVAAARRNNETLTAWMFRVCDRAADYADE